MHALERAALEDPFLADALEGYAPHVETVSSDVAELNSRLNERLKENKVDKPAPVVPLRRNWWWSAAAVVLIVVSAAVAYRLIWNKEENAIAHKEPSVKKATEEPVVDTMDISEKTDDPAVHSMEKTAPVQHYNTAEKAITAKAKSSAPDIPEKNAALKENAAVMEDVARLESKQSQQRTNAFLKKELPAFNIRGEVLDALQKPVAGVVVRLENEKTATLTDSMGMFSLRSKDSSAIATLNVLGFVPQKVELKTDIGANRIMLESNSATMDEVVVVGYGVKKKSTKVGSVSTIVKANPLKAVPEGGWPAYNQYLLDSARLKGVEGMPTSIVIVSFEVRPSGKLTRFRIEQSAGKIYDKDALRLIKEGPSWKTTTGKKETGRVTVTFK